MAPDERPDIEETKITRARCRRCDRILKSEDSIQLGYGPTCYKKIHIIHQKPLFDLEEETDER